jgi:hypothetical protein
MAARTFIKEIEGKIFLNNKVPIALNTPTNHNVLTTFKVRGTPLEKGVLSLQP